MKAMARQQRGVTFSGLLVWSFILIFLAIGGMKIVPSYVEEKTIRGILEQLAHDPEMQNADIHTIKDTFAKRANTMNNITVVTDNDLIIDKRSGNLVLSVQYQVKIPLVANATLLLDFNPSSTPAR